MKNNIINAVDNSIYKNNNKNILILSGGGIKGIAHIGGLKYLEEINLLNNIDTIAGTSVGSIIGYLFIIGFKPDQIFELVCKLNENDLFTFNLDCSFNSNFFLNNQLFKTISEICTIKNISCNLSFFDFYKIYKKKFIVTASCIDDGDVYYFDYINYPDMNVIQAVLMSSCIPFLYKPIKYKNKVFIDGGFIDNYPIHLFNNVLDNCIGFYLLENYNSKNPIENIETFIIGIIKCALSGHSKKSLLGFEKYSVIINSGDISSLDFNISLEQKKYLYNLGYNQCCSYFTKLSNLVHSQ